VYLEGSLRTRQYQTKEGETKYFTEVSVNDMVLTGGRPNGEASLSSGHTEMSAPVAVPASVGDDDLPF